MATLASRPIGNGGYRQEAAAGIMCDFWEIVSGLDRDPDNVAVLVDLAAGMKAIRKQREDPLCLRHDEPRRHDPRLCRIREFIRGDDEPVLVDDVEEIRALLREVPSAEDHLVRWRGEWTAGGTLMRVLDDTFAVRAVSGRMKAEVKEEAPRRPHLTTARKMGQRCSAAACGQPIFLGQPIRVLRGEVWHDGC